MKIEQKIKGLRSQLQTITGETEALKVKVAAAQRELNQKIQAANRLKEEIKRLEKPSVLRVSEHALVRYFQRVKMADIEAIEKEILSDQVRNMVDKLGGNGTYPNGDYSLVIRDYVVVTIEKK